MDEPSWTTIRIQGQDGEIVIEASNAYNESFLSCDIFVEVGDHRAAFCGLVPFCSLERFVTELRQIDEGLAEKASLSWEPGDNAILIDVELDSEHPSQARIKGRTCDWYDDPEVSKDVGRASLAFVLPVIDMSHLRDWIKEIERVLSVFSSSNATR